MKKKIFLLPCIAAVAIATFVGAKSFKTNASESNELLLQNVEALSQNNKNKDDDGGFNYVLNKDDCNVKVGSYAGFSAFVAKFKFSGSANLRTGDYIDLTDFTALYTPACWYHYFCTKVRLGEDIRCADLMREFNFSK